MTDLRRPDDEVLIAGALRGDEEALGRLLARDQEWAYNVAYRVLGQEADARDAVQDAFLQTVRALRGDGSPPRSIASYRPWLRRVVSNAAITQIRRRPSATVSPVDALADSVSGAAHAEPGHTVEREETRTRVLQALLSLPETQRVALALREVLDASYDEVADALDLPRTAVGTLLFRARAGFRAAYDRVSETAPPIDCPDLVPLFAAILDDEPRPAAWAELEDHLRGCERCQRDLEGQRRARRAYAALPLLALPAGWDPVVAALQGVAGGAVSGGAASGAAAGGAAAGEAGTPAGGAAGQSAAASAVPAASGASGAAASSTGAAASTAAGSAAASTSGGLIAGAVGAKLTIAALATAAVVGVGVVAGPLAGLGPDSAPGPAPSPSPLVAGAPAASPGLAPSPASTPLSGSTAAPALASPSPDVAASPGPAAGPFVTPSAEAPGTPQPLPADSPTVPPPPVP